MDAILTTRPISDFRQNQASIMEAMEAGPVVLTQHGRDATVARLAQNPYAAEVAKGKKERSRQGLHNI